MRSVVTRLKARIVCMALKGAGVEFKQQFSIVCSVHDRLSSTVCLLWIMAAFVPVIVSFVLLDILNPRRAIVYLSWEWVICVASALWLWICWVRFRGYVYRLALDCVNSVDQLDK
jgi:hypothetical protein